MKDTAKETLVWVAGGAGVLLIYSAYKGRNPVDTLRSYLGGSAAPTGTTSGAGVTSSTGRSTASSQLGAAPATDTSVGAPPSDVTGASVLSDSLGGSHVYDANGLIIGNLPDAYNNSPGTFIPGTYHVL